VTEAKLFPLGRIELSDGLARLVFEHGRRAVFDLLRRHASGDWGDDLDWEDVEQNRQALEYGKKLFSAYTLGANRIWITTESDRSMTRIFEPDEYFSENF
jgi:hypothetical protein